MSDKKRKIVCIEDEVDMIELIQLILDRSGYEILGADSGEEGLALVRREQPELILLDLMMPEMDGWEVYHRLKAEEATRSIPIIVVTAKAQQIDKVLGVHVAGVDDYITKPFAPRELVERVRRVLDPDPSVDGPTP